MNFPNTGVAALTHWSNFHHTIVDRVVPAYLTPGSEQAQAKSLTQALNAILQRCVSDKPTRLCTIGSRWSLSDILDPGDVILDPGAWNQIAAVEQAWLTPGYKQRAAPRGGSLHSEATSIIHRAVWRALKAANITFTCHWGQEYGMDQGSVRAYFGDRIERWKQARAQLLDTPAQRAVFINPLLERLGLA